VAPGLFPFVEPNESGMLRAGDGHAMYWETCGNPAGIPAVFLHGGPGSGCTPNQRRFFDPDVFQAVLFDQRGSGRSRPLASYPDADLTGNTTAHLIADMERLREHLGIDRWVVLGMSWGTTLGLAYAETHAERVRGLVLALVTTTSRREVDWITRDMGRVFPEEWDRFVAAVPTRLRDMSLADAYATLLFDADRDVQERAARAWCTWEDTHVSLVPGYQHNRRFDDPAFRLRFARLVTHYWRHAAFLEDDQLLRDSALLAGIPGVLIHGRYDVSSPLETAWRLSQSWRTSRLQVIDDTGHGGGEAFVAAVIEALRGVAK
jgi:proline iminopeptidase